MMMMMIMIIISDGNLLALTMGGYQHLAAVFDVPLRTLGFLG